MGCWERSTTSIAFIVKGLAVQQIRGYVVESLMARSNDEPFTLYGLLAQSIETDPERNCVTFRLNPLARFSDGKPVLAGDVLFSWRLMRDKGRPNHRLYYAKVEKAEALDERTVRFDFGNANDRELPLIMGLVPVFPEHAIDVATFEETSLTAPMGSGSYRVANVRPGVSVTLSRDPDYWGRDLPVNRGLWNFGEVRVDFYREANGAFEGFRRGLYDFRVETEPLHWHEGMVLPQRARAMSCGTLSSLERRSPRSFSPSTPVARSLQTSRYARRWRSCSVSNGSTATTSSASVAARGFFRGL